MTQVTYISWTNDDDVKISGVALIGCRFNTWNGFGLQSLCLLQNKQYSDYFVCASTSQQHLEMKHDIPTT